ncbi:hypothetical protein [Hydrogenimonas urashimensis]|uniref:hypothetical protein n=1 Tax=Hydrogenimonas urashimensis TaxID=2740515 RepID=UPI0019157B48|nr:hypothetical protein [Hydrogenimonas urashimensis]
MIISQFAYGFKAACENPVKGMPMSAEIIKTPEVEVVDAKKRAFMKKFGKYAVVGAGMATLMTPTLSSANNYCGSGSGHVTNEMQVGDSRVVSGTWDTNAIDNEDGWMAQLDRTETGYHIEQGTISTTDNLHAGTFTGDLWPIDENLWNGQGTAVFQGQSWSWTALGDASTRDITWSYCPQSM